MRRAGEAGTIKVVSRRGRAWSLGIVVLCGLMGRSCEYTMTGFDMMICVTHVAAGKIRIRTTFRGDLMRHRWVQGAGGQQGDNMAAWRRLPDNLPIGEESWQWGHQIVHHPDH